MENNNILFNELESMRSQIDALKKKIEKQTIVNGEHIRRSMTHKTSDIKRVVGWAIFMGVFALVYCTWFFWKMQLSTVFVVLTAVMLAVCLILTIVQKVQLSKVDYSSGNLLETAQVMSKMRSHYKNWYFIAVPMLLVWYGYLLYELFRIYSEQEWLIYFVAGSAVGVVIGGIIGVRMNNKVVRGTEQILSQIDELQCAE